MARRTTLVTLLLTALLAVAPGALAGSKNKDEACSVAENRLQIGTYAFYSDCDGRTFCNGTSGVCELKGCRNDIFPFGYPQGYEHLPPMCSRGEFCPDEQDQCQPVLPVNSPCQLNRDDQCEPPPEWRELRDQSGKGLNYNGSVCLNNICMWANVTVGQSCVVENTAYIAYGPDSAEFIDVISRGNCRLGLYCDAQESVCMSQKKKGDTCDADKECLSYNCEASGKCGAGADEANHVGAWVYAIVAICIFGGMIGTLVALFFIHRRKRDAEREKRMQYWREQSAFRQNIMQMRETAQNSVMSSQHAGGSPRSTLYSREGVGSEDSQLPILQTANKSSGLRHQYSDDGNYSDDGGVMMEHRPTKF